MEALRSAGGASDRLGSCDTGPVRHRTWHTLVTHRGDNQNVSPQCRHGGSNQSALKRDWLAVYRRFSAQCPVTQQECCHHGNKPYVGSGGRAGLKVLRASLLPVPLIFSGNELMRPLINCTASIGNGVADRSISSQTPRTDWMSTRNESSLCVTQSSLFLELLYATDIKGIGISQKSFWNCV